MRKIVLTFVLLLIVMGSSGRQRVPVILTAGQSNADGRVSLAELPEELKQYQYCQWSYGSGDFKTASGLFSVFSPRVAKPGIEQSWGFDAVIYHLLEQLWQRPYYVIKHTDGGTAIDPACKGSTHGLYWSAAPAFLDSTSSASHGGKSLLKAFCRQIDDCLPHLPEDYDIKCLIWHQGESDQQAADRYYDNMKAVVAYIRQHLVEKTGRKRYATLPVVCATFSKDSRQGSPVVADALRRIAHDDQHFYVVEAEDLPLLRDRLHFNAEGAQTLGRRVYDLMVEQHIVARQQAEANQSGGTDIVWFDGQHPVSYQIVGKTDPVVKIALQMFCSDMEQVTGMKPVASKSATIRIVQGHGSDDGFRISVTPKGQILVEGHNGRGTAYGLLELSRMAGVSPWVWWGDVTPERQSRLVLPSDFAMEHTPSVAYRGIFINDEDWSLRNWAWKNYEKTDQFGAMGPKTYKAIFQLLLRLRANAIWPAMHTGTPGFFTIKGNKEMADSCGILIGTSHCEPLLRNNVAEWNHAKRGDYNYITNREQVQQYWIERLQQVKGSEELFTIGMRGIHDGSMEGVKTKEEKLTALQQVIDDQRELISKYYLDKTNRRQGIEQVPQVFIPYKEVLEIMESGLRVPDDVTLMWCDDNYGYMTRLSDADQQKRSGGGGVYYHLSYWGRPHDYLWLTTTQSGLVYSEMKAAYDHNCRKLWIVNVHDPKVAAYDLELFLDMAWDISLAPAKWRGNADDGSTDFSEWAGGRLEQHLGRWLCTQFGNEAGEKLLPAMKEFYRLCGIRKPEFMGWTQVELSDRKAYPRGRSQVVDTEFSLTEFDNEAWHYLSAYEHICLEVQEAEKLVRPELKDAYFAHVKYPILGARAMAAKMLEAQMARSKYQGQTDRSMEGREGYMMQHAARAMYAYRDIQRLTRYYNDSLAGGKWKGIMNMMPRDLNVFNPPILPYMPEEDALSDYGFYLTHPVFPDNAIARNACKYQSATQGVQTIQMLGHSMNAVAIPKGDEVVYEFTVRQELQVPDDGDAVLYTAMIPTQPNDRGDLRYEVTLDDQEPVVISLKEKYRSEFWKQSVLRGQALKQTPVKVEKGRHRLKIKALDDHIIIDQWMLDYKKNRKFYVIPAK